MLPTMKKIADLLFASRRVLSGVACGIALVLTTSTAFAAVRINEVLVNPPGADNGFEYFELLSDSGAESLDGLTLLVFEGDTGASGLSGKIDAAVDLSGNSTGSNGLLLWRDASTVIPPGPENETTVVSNDFGSLENGSSTFALVSGFTGTQGDDLDTDDDGIFDGTLPWTSVLDSIAILEEGDPDDKDYATALGGTALPRDLPFTPGLIFRPFERDDWVAAEVATDSETSVLNLREDNIVFEDGLALSPTSFSPATATPGAANAEFLGFSADYNLDGVVDAADYTLWRSTLGDTVVAFDGADGNGNGEVDEADYRFWRIQYGTVTDAGSASATVVPEPASALLMIGILFGLISRRR